VTKYDVLGEWLQATAADHADRVALEASGVVRTYGDIATDTLRLAAGLAALGLRRGDRVAVFMVNSARNVDTWFAICSAGFVEVPINTANRGDLLRYLIHQSGSQVMVVDADLAPRVVELVEGLPNLRHLVVNGDPTELAGLPGHVTAHRLSDLYLDAGDFVAPRLSEGDPATIIYTAGTTGPSKGAVLSHRMGLNLTHVVTRVMEYTRDDVLYTAFPLFHANAKYTSVMAAMQVGGKLIMEPRFSASNFWETCRTHEVTAFNYMGALLAMLWKQPERPEDADNAVRAAFGAPCPKEIFEAFERRFGLSLTEIYGMTEITMVSCDPPPNRRIGSAGKATEDYEIRIADETDRPVPPNTPGEIQIRPRSPFVMMQGYHDMPAETLAAYRNLWFHTGDRGRMDEDGYLYFIDRMKDCLRRRGENISSFEVEKVINEHPGVLESGVYGVPSDLTEDDVMVCVVPQNGISVTPEELLDFCQERMAYFAVPRYVRFAPELPKTPSQRIQKFKLREEGITADTWDRAAHGYEVRR
jgi:crotonobetaine/carnitine-CoA ligase